MTAVTGSTNRHGVGRKAGETKPSPGRESSRVKPPKYPDTPLTDREGGGLGRWLEVRCEVVG